MYNNRFKNAQRFNYNRERHSSEEKESDDDDDDDGYLFLDISTPMTKTKSSTEALIGIQQKPQKIIDWLPVLSIILAAIICLVAFIILCKRQMHYQHHIHSHIKQRRDNRNNNQIPLLSIDVAECIDDDIEFVAGLNILLAKGNIILNDDDAEMLNSMNTFDRLQYFQNLANDIK